MKKMIPGTKRPVASFTIEYFIETNEIVNNNNNKPCYTLIFYDPAGSIYLFTVHGLHLFQFGTCGTFPFTTVQ